MFRNLLNPENALMITLSRITDCVFLSLFWILGCFPVVTMGAACAALYDSTWRGFRQGEKHPWQRFWQVFKTNWKEGLLPSVVYIAVFALGAKALIELWNGAVYGTVVWPVFSAGALIGVLALGILGVMFPVLSRFENSFGGLLKNTVLLALANLPRTLALGILHAVSIGLCVKLVAPVFILPSLTALLGSFLVEPMFRPFLAQEQTEEDEPARLESE